MLGPDCGARGSRWLHSPHQNVIVPRGTAWPVRCRVVACAEVEAELRNQLPMKAPVIPMRRSSRIPNPVPRMPARCAPSLLPGSATCRGNSFSRTALKDSSFSRLRISEAERGDPPQDTPRRASEKMKGQGNSRARALIDNCNLDPQLKK
jgi:hypothetical protein